MRTLLRRLGYPAFLLVAVGTSGVLVVAGGPALAQTGGVVLVSALLIGALERIAPHSPRWHLVPRTAALDVTHSLVSAFAVVPVVRGGLAWLFFHAAAAASGWLDSGLWPSSWPLALQLALAVVVADFGAYWAHRSMHRFDVLWRIHVLHHSPVGLNFLAAGRSHPFNALLTLSAETAMVLALGISPDALALLTVYKGVNGLLQHSNIDLRPGLLSQILATSDVHRWHHSRSMAESNTNFGNATMIWDRLFGTFYLPHDRKPPLEVGVEGLALPERYLAHLALPFVMQRYQQEDGDPQEDGA